jgi:hypothetical protein
MGIIASLGYSQSTRGVPIMLTFFGKGPERSGTSAQTIKTLQTVRGYWDALRQGGAIPRREQIDPRGMADCLDKVFLIERIAVGHARFRLAGMGLNDIMGMDVRGMPFSTLFEPVARSRIAQELEQVFTAPSIMEIWLEAERSTGRPALSGRMMLLPVATKPGEPGQALGCMVTEGALGRQPRRFAISGMVRELIATPKMQLMTYNNDLPPKAAVLREARPSLRLVSSRD